MKKWNQGREEADKEGPVHEKDTVEEERGNTSSDVVMTPVMRMQEGHMGDQEGRRSSSLGRSDEDSQVWGLSCLSPGGDGACGKWWCVENQKVPPSPEVHGRDWQSAEGQTDGRTVPDMAYALTQRKF